LYLLYDVLLAIGFALSLPFFLWKGRATGKYVRTFRERWNGPPKALNPEGARSIWIHAVSVGEVLAARTLIQPLKERFPSRKLLLSTTTVTGNAIARASARGFDGLFFAPFDLPRPVRSTLDVVKPDLLVLVETEIWPNLIHAARLSGARIALVNGRISPRSFPRYRMIRAFLKPVLREIDLFLMQGEAHGERVRAMGAAPERVRSLGNLKFDALDAPRAGQQLDRLLATAARRPLWVAGSTAAGEEETVLRSFQRLRERVPTAALVIAPRHPERFSLIPSLVEAAGFSCVRRTQLQPGGTFQADVLLLDTLGELAHVYALATVVFVGGSLAPAGGHNILEPAVAGKAIVVGPHMENFQEIADEFRAEDALVQVADEEQLGREVVALFADEARRSGLGERARALVTRNRGALAETLTALAGLLG
jgi:3-deoxy-D-manno-octulosonic-acid transferase